MQLLKEIRDLADGSLTLWKKFKDLFLAAVISLAFGGGALSGCVTTRTEVIPPCPVPSPEAALELMTAGPGDGYLFENAPNVEIYIGRIERYCEGIDELVE